MRSVPMPALFLILFGCFSLLYALLLIPIDAGLLRYDREGAQAIFVIVFAITIAFLGLTPFGALRRSWALFWGGLGLVLVGATAFVSPGTAGRLIGVLLVVMLMGLGLVRLPVFLVRRRRDFADLPTDYVAVFCALHALSALLGLSLLLPVPMPAVIGALLCLGVAQLLLGAISIRIETAEPGSLPSTRLLAPAATPGPGIAGWGPKPLLMLLLAITMLYLAVFAFLGGSGRLPFDSSRSSVLFLFITALQVILVGETPVHTFVRSWPVIGAGMLVACLVFVAAVVPGLLDQAFGVVLGWSNLLAAGFGFAHLFSLAAKVRAGVPPEIAVSLRRLIVASGLAYLLVLCFAANLLFPNVIPGLAMLVILLATGAALFRLAVLISRLPSGGEN